MGRAASIFLVSLIGGCAIMAPRMLRPATVVEGPIVPDPPRHIERPAPPPTKIDQKLDAVQKAVDQLRDELTSH